MKARHILLILGLVVALVAGTVVGVRWGLERHQLRQPSWAPTPQTIDGLEVVASVTGSGEESRTALHTAHGDVTFWNGVNLGAAPPGHNPGEVAIDRETYRRWLQEMGDMRVSFLRIYTIHRPEFYEELRDYNLNHPEHPIYLIQGVYLPDESYLETGDLWKPGPTAAFTQEIRDASAAVSGDLVRPQTLGRAYGTYTADVSDWLAGWVIGVEWDPYAIHKSDLKNAGKQPYTGTYFYNPAEATTMTSTEVWLAQRMDELATAEVARGRSMPMAFVNWPTTDPLEHPQEPLPTEDWVGVDANHVLATQAWPGGTFASYHAYPYYPDFLRHEPDYKDFTVNGQVDAYAGYLVDLKRHYAQQDLPLMVTEFGVPSSIGNAHFGTNGRDQGAHTEEEAMQMNADMLRMFADIGLDGGLLFLWTDEWFKFTWNTVVRQGVVDSERRALWHDPLTNEQWFGVIAQDPVSTGWRTLYEAREGVTVVAVDTDASFVHMRIEFKDPPEQPVRIEFAGAPGVVEGTTHAFVYDPQANTMQAFVQDSVDPIHLDGLKPEDLPAVDASGWSLQRLTTNRSLKVAGQMSPAEFYEVGNMIEGTWDPEARDYNSLATWNVDGNTLNMRIPWSMLGVADPSSATAVVPNENGDPVGVPITGLPFTIDTGDGPAPYGEVKWDPWQQAQATERMKRGWKDLRLAFVETSRSPSPSPSP